MRVACLLACLFVCLFAALSSCFAALLSCTGVRLLICQKNIGKSKYAFNAIQVRIAAGVVAVGWRRSGVTVWRSCVFRCQARMLPKEYKPPVTTISEGKIAT